LTTGLLDCCSGRLDGSNKANDMTRQHIGATAPAGFGRRRARLPETTAQSGWSLVTPLVIAFLLPNYFSLNLGGTLLTPVRIVLIALFIPALIMFFTHNRGRLYAFDVLFVMFSLWSVLAILMKYGAGGIENAGQFFLETTVTYLLVQSALRSVRQIEALFRGLFLVMCVLMVFAYAEAMAGRHLLLDFASRITGNGGVSWQIAGERLGFMRATTIFGHPILYGIFCSTLLSVVWYTERNTSLRIFKTLLVVAATLPSLSSAPLLVLLMQIGLIAGEATTRWLPARATIMGSLVAAFVTAVSFISNRGAFVLVAILTLDPSTAYMRREIWNYGWRDNVLPNPVFGIMIEYWSRPDWMPPSIDNFWLFQMMRGGIPSVVFLALAIILMLRRIYRAPITALDPDHERLRRGWSYMIIAMILCGMTVHFFDKIQLHFALMLAVGGAIIRIIDTAPARETAAAPAAAPLRPARIQASASRARAHNVR
jgi:hypothetical protein